MLVTYIMYLISVRELDKVPTAYSIWQATFNLFEGIENK